MNPFWKRSPVQEGHAIKREAKRFAAEVEDACEKKKSRLDEAEARVSENERQLQDVEEKTSIARLKID